MTEEIHFLPADMHSFMHSQNILFSPFSVPMDFFFRAIINYKAGRNLRFFSNFVPLFLYILLISFCSLSVFSPPPAPSPLPSRSRSSSVGESLGLGGGRAMRALVSHPSSSNPKLLPFNRGETVTVLVQEPRNGWLYGRTDSSLRWVAEIKRFMFMHAGAGAIELCFFTSNQKKLHLVAMAVTA